MKQIEKIKKLFADKKNMSNIFIILIIGVILLLFGSSFRSSKPKAEALPAAEIKTNTEQSYEESLEKRLSNILSQLEGVGSVSVMISFEKGEEILPVYDTKTTETVTGEEDSAGGRRTTTEKNNEQITVMTQKGSGYSEPVVAYKNNPVPIGVIVVAKGAESPLVKSNITEAVKAVISVPSHRIQVFNK